MNDPRIELLDGLTARLEHLVSTLGGDPSPATADLERAWGAVGRAFERYREVAEGFRPGDASEEVRTRVEAVLRLDAVAAGLATRHRDALGGELRKVAGARSRLNALEASRRSDGTGGTCDIAG